MQRHRRLGQSGNALVRGTAATIAGSWLVTRLDARVTLVQANTRQDSLKKIGHPDLQAPAAQLARAVGGRLEVAGTISVDL